MNPQGKKALLQHFESVIQMVRDIPAEQIKAARIDVSNHVPAFPSSQFPGVLERVNLGPSELRATIEFDFHPRPYFQAQSRPPRRGPKRAKRGRK